MFPSLDPQKYLIFRVVASYPYTFQKPREDQGENKWHLPLPLRLCNLPILGPYRRKFFFFPAMLGYVCWPYQWRISTTGFHEGLKRIYKFISTF